MNTIVFVSYSSIMLKNRNAIICRKNESICDKSNHINILNLYTWHFIVYRAVANYAILKKFLLSDQGKVYIS